LEVKDPNDPDYLGHVLQISQLLPYSGLGLSHFQREILDEGGDWFPQDTAEKGSY
jgi:hypothetical protein